MGLYGFKLQFCPAIRSGEKTHTIRGKRKHPDAPGSTAHCFYALRTKHSSLLLRAPVTRVDDIVLADSGTRFQHIDAVYPQIEIDGVRLCGDEMDALAVRDGFANLWSMSSFWDLSVPFHGDMTHWDYARRRLI